MLLFLLQPSNSRGKREYLLIFAFSLVLSSFLMFQDSFSYYFLCVYKTACNHSFRKGLLVTNSSFFFILHSWKLYSFKMGFYIDSYFLYTFEKCCIPSLQGLWFLMIPAIIGIIFLLITRCSVLLAFRVFFFVFLVFRSLNMMYLDFFEFIFMNSLTLYL